MSRARQGLTHSISRIVPIVLLLVGGFTLCTSQVRAATFPIIAVLHAGGHPEALAVDQTTHKLYIAYEAPGAVVCFDPLSGNVCWRTSLGDGVTDLQVDSTSHRLFVAYNVYHSDATYLALLDGANGKIDLNQQTGNAGENTLAFDAHLQRIYFANIDTATLYTFSFTSNWQTLLQTTQRRAGPQPSAIAVNNHLGRLYIADRRENVLRIFDEQTQHLLKTLALGAVPLPPIRIDEQTNRLFVLCSTDQKLEVIDMLHNTLTAEVPVGPYPEGLAIHTATGRIYVADEGDNEASNHQQETGTTISVLDGESYESLGTLRVGTAPDGVEADPGLQRIYVAVEDANAVLEISDSADLPLQSDVTLQQRARALAFADGLGRAGWVTLITMLATLLLATLASWLRRPREQESPQTPPASASSRSDQHSLSQ